MSASINLICCNFSYVPQNSSKFKTLIRARNLSQQSPVLSKRTSNSSVFLKPNNRIALVSPFQQKGVLKICQSSLNTQNSEEEAGQDKGLSVDNGKEGRDWTTSILLFVLWGALMYYVFNLSPNQTPSRDMYFLKKLLNLKGDDGFRMNEVLVSQWYIMGLWPLVYSMLLLPTGRSPPPPPVDENELEKWPLNFLESKLTAGMALAAGIGLIIYAGLANADIWREFFQYFRESKFIHIMSLDFTLLSAFAPFWVYNDMTARKWYDKGFWLLPLSLVPILGPALYLVLRPSLSDLSVTAAGMLNKFLNVRKLAPFYSHGRPKPVAQLQQEPRENQGTSALKIVHPGGVVECYYMAIPAVNIMKNYPSSVLARPEVFRRPWDSLVRSHEILTPGQKFYVVPRHTVRKLRRRIRKTSGEVSVSQSSIDVSKYGSSSKQFEVSDSSGVSGSFTSKSRKKNGTKKHVRFAGVDVIKISKDEGIAIAESSKKKSNVEFQQQGGKGKSRNVVLWQPRLPAISERHGPGE
ncbi:hypothetical protein Godav_018149 [Gossypium davidsonii]|uniref:Uncharacterized protein n=4 Tax=Gossypium TaxID=3633 RepID=A0A7J8QWT8_GOSDV|nr:hypothetical protein [Gossypium davidsonii]